MVFGEKGVGWTRVTSKLSCGENIRRKRVHNIVARECCYRLANSHIGKDLNAWSACPPTINQTITFFGRKVISVEIC